jgi:hypothetical protein
MAHDTTDEAAGPDLRERGRGTDGRPAFSDRRLWIQLLAFDGAPDNDFVLGLVGPELHPLSAMVQAMRRTRQTSNYLASLGPFFVGRAVWQSPST